MFCNVFATKTVQDEKFLQFWYWILQPFHLLAQIDHLILPVTGTGKPGEVMGECRVIPATCNPGVIVQQSQTAQALDEAQLANIKIGECFIAI